MVRSSLHSNGIVSIAVLVILFAGTAACAAKRLVACEWTWWAWTLPSLSIEKIEPAESGEMIRATVAIQNKTQIQLKGCLGSLWDVKFESDSISESSGIFASTGGHCGTWYDLSPGDSETFQIVLGRPREAHGEVLVTLRFPLYTCDRPHCGKPKYRCEVQANQFRVTL